MSALIANGEDLTSGTGCSVAEDGTLTISNIGVGPCSITLTPNSE